jgi:oligoendopeptidase F
MSMELLGADHFDIFYAPGSGNGSSADAVRAKRSLLEGIVRMLPWIATIDLFQHWVYTHPGHTRERRTRAWLDIYGRYSDPAIDWSGYEPMREAMWQRQLHLFHHPFYYVEYGIAQLGALQLWQNYRRDPREALEAYRGALKLGGTRPLPKLFEAAGVKFDFSEKTLRPLMRELGQVMAELPS